MIMQAFAVLGIILSGLLFLFVIFNAVEGIGGKNEYWRKP